MERVSDNRSNCGHNPTHAVSTELYSTNPSQIELEEKQ